MLLIIINNINTTVVRNSHIKYFLSKVNIINYNVLIDGKNFIINLLMIKSKNLMKLEKLLQDKEMIIQQDVVRLSILQRSISITWS